MRKFYKDLRHFAVEVEAIGGEAALEKYEKGFVTMDETIQRLLELHECKRLWESFSEVTMDPESEELQESFMGFPARTHREEIWHAFERRYNVRVADLMYLV